jgi:hypothetical protein
MIKKAYEKYLLPKLLDKCCSTKPINYQRNKIVPHVEGTVLEIGIGSGLNIPYYNKSNIHKVYGLDPSAELCEMDLAHKLYEYLICCNRGYLNLNQCLSLKLYLQHEEQSYFFDSLLVLLSNTYQEALEVSIFRMLF